MSSASDVSPAGSVTAVAGVVVPDDPAPGVRAAGGDTGGATGEVAVPVVVELVALDDADWLDEPDEDVWAKAWTAANNAKARIVARMGSICPEFPPRQRRSERPRNR